MEGRKYTAGKLQKNYQIKAEILKAVKRNDKKGVPFSDAYCSIIGTDPVETYFYPAVDSDMPEGWAIMCRHVPEWDTALGLCYFSKKKARDGYGPTFLALGKTPEVYGGSSIPEHPGKDSWKRIVRKIGQGQYIVEPDTNSNDPELSKYAEVILKKVETCLSRKSGARRLLNL